MTTFHLFLFLVLLPAVWSACPSGSIYNSDVNRCYLFVANAASFINAESKCTEWGGHLTSVSNGFENLFIAGKASSYFTGINIVDFWIGASELMSSDWQWLDKKPFTFTNWAPGQPLTAGGKQCVSTNLVSALWQASVCTSTKPFVCSMTAVQPTQAPTIPPGHCEYPNHYLERTDSCYYVFGGTAEFEQSEAACVSWGGHLASIHSQEENDFLARLAHTGSSSANSRQAWIGLSQYDGNSPWRWTDGTDVDYTHWADGEPSDSWGTEHCSEFMVDNENVRRYQRWNDLKCTYSLTYICKRPALH